MVYLTHSLFSQILQMLEFIMRYDYTELPAQ